MCILYQTHFLYLQLCTSAKVSDKTTYKTFARTILDPGHLAHEILKIFEHFKWNRTAIIWEDIPVWQKRKDTLLDTLKKNFVTVASTARIVSVNKYSRNRNEKDYKRILEALKAEARSKCLLTAVSYQNFVEY